MTNNALLLDPAHDPAADDPFAGATLRLPPVAEHAEVARAYTAACCALNARLNELLFDAMALGAAERAKLGSKPFVVRMLLRWPLCCAGRLWRAVGPPSPRCRYWFTCASPGWRHTLLLTPSLLAGGG